MLRRLLTSLTLLALFGNVTGAVWVAHERAEHQQSRSKCTIDGHDPDCSICQTAAASRSTPPQPPPVAVAVQLFISVELPPKPALISHTLLESVTARGPPASQIG
jgi:hypothetical protein